jgi:hypothetical protein
MDVQVALVKVDPKYTVDRWISGLRGGQEFSHAALVLRPGEWNARWYDVHWRWFASDLRDIPAENYAWSHSYYPLKDLTPEKGMVIAEWVLEQQGKWVHYDICGAFRILLDLPPESSPRSFTCFEFVTRALLEAGYDLEYDPEKALGSDLMESGVLLGPVREVMASE